MGSSRRNDIGEDNGLIMKKVSLTLACGDYEIVRALKDGVVQPDGIDLTVLTAMDSSPRHWRFLRKQEYDMGGLLFRLSRRARPGAAVPRDPGIPASALPPRVHLHQHHQRHQAADRPHRKTNRSQAVPGHRHRLDARHLGARIRRAAEVHRMGPGT
jgi:hypothetical protein